MKYDLHLLKCRLPEYLRAIGCQLSFTSDDHFSTACPIHNGTKKKFHADRQPNGEWVWICRTGCGGEGGTVLDLHARRHGLNARTRQNIAGTAEAIGIQSGTEIKPPPPPPKPKPRKLELPALDRGTPEEIELVASHRGIQPYALEIAIEVGTLRFGTVCGKRSWILTDAAGKIAEARRIDGKPFEAVGSHAERKAHTARGSSKAWPVGLHLDHGPAEPGRGILLTEGGPDYLAALDFLCRFKRQGWQPVSMLGASTQIDTEALEILAGRRVRIYAHHDPKNSAGMTAARRWFRQLREAGCEVDGFSFAGPKRTDGKPVTDLNDLLLADEESRKAWEGVLP